MFFKKFIYFTVIVIGNEHGSSYTYRKLYT